jgi:hypothetical protein
MIHSVAQISGLEIGSLTEHIFLPDLAFVIYRRGTTMDLLSQLGMADGRHYQRAPTC